MGSASLRYCGSSTPLPDLPSRPPSWDCYRLSRRFFGPIIGVIVDRYPKKAILIGSDVARGFLIGVIPCWISVENFTVESLYFITFLYGIATALFVPTLSSAVPFMVQRPQFTAANALLQTTTSLGIIVGPALSGVGIAFSGSQDVLCLNAVTYLASAACLLPIRVRSTEPNHTDSAGARQFGRYLIEGIRYAFLTHRTSPDPHRLGFGLYVRHGCVHDAVPRVRTPYAWTRTSRSGLSMVLARGRPLSLPHLA